MYKLYTINTIYFSISNSLIPLQLIKNYTCVLFTAAFFLYDSQ